MPDSPQIAIILNEAGFRRIVTEVVLDVLGEHLRDERPTLLREVELARQLSCSQKTVMRLRREGMPHVVLGENSPRYRLDDVVEWLNERKQQP